MIHLMLEDNGGKTSYRILMFTPLFIPITQNNPLRTLNIPTQIGYRQTPLTAKLRSRRASEDFGIEKKLKRLVNLMFRGLFLLREWDLNLTTSGL